MQQPDQPEPRWSNDSGLSLALDVATALSPATSVLALVSGPAGVQALQSLIQSAPASFSPYQASIGFGTNERLLHERCVPGTLEKGLDNLSGV